MLFYFWLHFQPLCPVTDFYFCSILCWESCFWLILLVNWFFIVFVDFSDCHQSPKPKVLLSFSAINLLDLTLTWSSVCFNSPRLVFCPFSGFFNAHCHFHIFLTTISKSSNLCINFFLTMPLVDTFNFQIWESLLLLLYHAMLIFLTCMQADSHWYCLIILPHSCFLGLFF